MSGDLCTAATVLPNRLAGRDARFRARFGLYERAEVSLCQLTGRLPHDSLFVQRRAVLAAAEAVSRDVQRSVDEEGCGPFMAEAMRIQGCWGSES